jgi:glutathione S-transferase
VKANKWIAGDELSFADFYIAGNLYSNFLNNQGKYEPDQRASVLKNYPAFAEYGKRFEKELEAYLNSDTRLKNAFI